MKTYAAYGLIVRSEVPMPELVEGVAGVEPDVEVVYGNVDWDSSGGGERIVAQLQDLVRFELVSGRRVVIEKLKPVDDDVLRSRLLGEIFAGVLRQRGHLVLHACAVAGRGGAVCIMGESGWGKSTLAEALRLRGYTLITDDVAAFAFNDHGLPSVIPAYPQIRLRNDSAAYLAPNDDDLTPIMRNGPKLARSNMMLAETTPVRAAYYLEPGFRKETAIVDVPPQEAVVHLVAHTRARTLIHTNTPALLADHLQQCSGFVRSVKPRVLQRRKSFEALGEVMDAIEADSGVHPSTTYLAHK